MPSFLKRNKMHFENALRMSIEMQFGKKTKLRDACEYALLDGGKRIRPLLVLLVADGLGKGADVMEAALSIEYFHTASLIADDMPCMDNDSMRRCKPALHKAYGETVALLSTYALIAAGYEKIYKSAEKMRLWAGNAADEACTRALKYASKCAGVDGATGGQFLDLFPPQRDRDTIWQVIQKKTVAPFEVAFLFGWFFGGGDFSRIQDIQKLALHFGLAFQIADDLHDRKQDEGKEMQSNISLVLGEEKSLDLFCREISQLTDLLSLLGMNSPHFQELIHLIENYPSLSNDFASAGF